MVAEILLSAQLHVHILDNFRNIEPNRKQKKTVKLLDDQSIYRLLCIYQNVFLYKYINVHMCFYVPILI